MFPIVLGGDHAITLAELRAHAARHGPLALVHLDAHGDTWHEYFGQRYYHGTTFRRAAEEGVIDPSASVQAGHARVAVRRRRTSATRATWASPCSRPIELLELGPAGYGDLVRERVGGRPAFLSFDVDFCDPAFAPGTGTPEIGGPTSGQAAAFVRALTGVNLVGLRRGRGLAVVRLARPADGAPGREHRLGDDLAPRPRTRPGGAGVKLYYAGDVHGSEKCWRKFLNAAKFYEADTLIMGGDITGKLMVPVVATADGRHEARVLGRPRDRRRPTRSRTWRSGSGSTASTRTAATGPSTTA